MVLILEIIYTNATLLSAVNMLYAQYVMLARSKLNSIAIKAPEALINNEIIHEDFWQLLIKKQNIEN